MEKLNTLDMRDAFFYSLFEEAKKNHNIMFLTDDHGAFALEEFEKILPKQFINIGIAEQNLIGVASGLSISGKIVCCYGISPFVSSRVLEHITLDIAAMGSNVSIISVGAGFTYSTDGPSHHGLQEIQTILSVPDIVLLNSSDPVSTSEFAKMATFGNGPHYIRIEKGKLKELNRINHKDFTRGCSLIKKGEDATIICSGAIIHEAIDACNHLKNELNLNVSIIDLYRLKPFPNKNLMKLLESCKKIITIEENYLHGGLGSLILTFLNNKKIYTPVLRIGVEDKFFYKYGSRDYLLNLSNLSGKKIFRSIKNWIRSF